MTMTSYTLREAQQDHVILALPPAPPLHRQQRGCEEHALIVRMRSDQQSHSTRQPAGFLPQLPSEQDDDEENGSGANRRVECERHIQIRIHDIRSLRSEIGT